MDITLLFQSLKRSSL